MIIELNNNRLTQKIISIGPGWKILTKKRMMKMRRKDDNVLKTQLLIITLFGFPSKICNKDYHRPQTDGHYSESRIV